MSISSTWGTTPEERMMAYPCDSIGGKSGTAQDLYRGVTIDAPPDIVFRWVCQLRVAPYSYDWIDNRCRKSPRVLTPGLEELNIGQWFMAGLTRVVDFTPNRQVTIQNDPSWRTYGDFKVSYVIVEQDAARCRLLVKMVVEHAHGLTGWLMRRFLPWGDLVMMRKQLLTLKALSERTYRDHGCS